MADTDRGAYTPPTDAPLSFDARQPVRGSRPIPFTLIISGVVLAALVVAIFVFYRSGVREAGQPPQTVGAAIGEMKTAAPAEAQPQDPAAGLQIYKAENGQPAEDAPIFTAPPETPQARPAAPPVVIAPPSAPVSAEPALRPSIRTVETPPAKIVPPPAPKVAATPAAKVVATAPPPKPAAPVAKAPAPVVKAAAPAAAAGGGAVVQIGAVSSTALADKAWSDAVAAAPGLAAGKGKSVEKIEKNGGTLYRTAVTGFGSRADATAFCDRLKSAGKSCFVR